MTRRIRTILFLIFAILFILIAPSAVFYSQGYRFDFKTRKITQTGAFYFKVWPKSVQIYLDGKQKKKTDFFFDSAFIENLLPQKYTVEIKKEGFHPWKKTLEIKEKEVTEAKNVILITENPTFTILENGVKDFFFTPNQKKVIFKTETEESWALKLFDLERKVKSHLIEEKEISRKGVEFLDLNFSPDSKKVLLKVGLKEDLKYFILDLTKSPADLLSLEFLGQAIEKISFNPRDPKKLFLFKNESLFEGDLIKKEVSLALLENILTYQIFNENIYYLGNSGLLFKSDFSGRNLQSLSLVPFQIKKETNYKLVVKFLKILLQEGGKIKACYLFDQDLKKFEKLFEGVRDFRFSPDSKKLIYFNNYEIQILFLEQQYSQPLKKAGDQIFVARFSEKIDEVFWLTSHYLIFNTGNKIKVAEIDDRDRINIVDLAEFPSVANSYGGSSEAFGEGGKNPEIFWNEIDKKLYVLSNANLYGSEKLSL